MMKHRNKKSKLVGKGLLFSYLHISLSLKGVRQELKKVRTWLRVLIQKPWRNAVYCFALHGRFSLLPYRTQNHHLRDGAVHNGLVQLHYYLIKCPPARSHASIFSNEVLSVQMSLDCIKLT